MSPTLLRRSMPLALLLTLLVGIAQAASYKVDESHVDVTFKVRHAGLAWTRGTFQKVSGTIQFDEATPDKANVEIIIEAASINTNNENRDNHLRSDDFLDVENHPTLVFKATKVENYTGTSMDLVGKLTIRGTTRDVTLHVTELSPEVTIEEWGGVVKRHATAHTKIDRRDFGLEWTRMLGVGNLTVGNEVHIEIDLELDKVS